MCLDLCTTWPTMSIGTFHCICAKYTEAASIAFIKIPSKVVPFPQFEAQTRCVSCGCSCACASASANANASASAIASECGREWVRAGVSVGGSDCGREWVWVGVSVGGSGSLECMHVIKKFTLASCCPFLLQYNCLALFVVAYMPALFLLRTC